MPGPLSHSGEGRVNLVDGEPKTFGLKRTCVADNMWV
jgi:hypothetical protein